MTRHFFIFLGTFVAGALIALAARTATYRPHAGHDAAAHTAGEYAPMVTNSPPAATHAGHGAAAPAAAATPTPPASTDGPVNTRCAICGMPVDPSLPTAEYQGKKIGFGCKMCAPKFKAAPDKYGPYYLRNEVIAR